MSNLNSLLYQTSLQSTPLCTNTVCVIQYAFSLVILDSFIAYSTLATCLKSERRPAAGQTKCYLMSITITVHLVRVRVRVALHVLFRCFIHKTCLNCLFTLCVHCKHNRYKFIISETDSRNIVQSIPLPLISF